MASEASEDDQIAAAFGGMDLDDPEWSDLLGGYRIPYDPRNAFRRLEQGDDVPSVWDELWNELHHQGDVGPASFAAIPHLVRIHTVRGIADWNTYAMAAIIEDVRHSSRNPDLPERMRRPYELAWEKLVDLGLCELKSATDATLVTSIIAVLAIGKGQLNIGRLAIAFTEDEREEILREAGWGR